MAEVSQCQQAEGPDEQPRKGLLLSQYIVLAALHGDDQGADRDQIGYIENDLNPHTGAF